ncbi:RMD1 [Symbiodinium sp. KB8]|nr:RMD1 [Symbiodinium sp. KB8]
MQPLLLPVSPKAPGSPRSGTSEPQASVGDIQMALQGNGGGGGGAEVPPGIKSVLKVKEAPPPSSTRVRWRWKLTDAVVRASTGENVGTDEDHRSLAERLFVEPSAQADVFILDYGAVVCWGLTEALELMLLEALEPYLEKPVEEVEDECMAFLYGSHIAIVRDVVTLSSISWEEKLSVSYALSQSVKLDIIESRVDETINRTNYIPEQLAITGKISLTSRDISRKMGELFIERNSVNLTSDLLDTPDFVWEADARELAYERVRKYLDIPNRIEVVNQRLSILKELLEILSSQLENQHASRLEWIVIWLIVVEVWGHCSSATPADATAVGLG